MTRSEKTCGDTCSQLLKPPRTTQSRDESVQKKLGGWPIECDVCEEEYCLECSTKMQTQVTVHVGVTCKVYQRSLDPLVQTHAIREAALNLTCPHCHMVFFVTCAFCHNDFCGLCLKACTSSQDTHQHVLQCDANVNKGNYFCSTDQLNQAHANMRKQKLISELLSIENLEIRKKVLEDLEQDMKDLECYVNPNQVGLS